MTQNRCAFSNFQQQQQRIVGGNAATTVIPWQVYLLSDKTCGGTILDEWTILSAAHCYDDYPWKNSSVRAGTLDRDSGGQVSTIHFIIFYKLGDAGGTCAPPLFLPRPNFYICICATTFKP